MFGVDTTYQNAAYQQNVNVLLRLPRAEQEKNLQLLEKASELFIAKVNAARAAEGKPPIAAPKKAIQYLDTTLKPFQTQVPLVDTFERLKRLKADNWQRDFCQKLQDATENQHDKGIRALVHAPPQHGKSVILAQVFPVWLLGHNPLFRVALATYNIERSQRHANVAIRLMQSPFYKELFPKKDCHLPAIVGAQNFFTNARRELNDGQASINPMGLQSGFVGTGADTLVIDDPYRSAEEANSETIREKIEVFWDETSNTRLTEQANVFGMFHRYHQADLAGYLLATGEFDYWRYAAEADGAFIDDETGLVYDDPLGRTDGEFLTTRPPFTSYFYEKQKKNPKTWYSQFQGKPTGEEGNTFNIKKIHVLEVGSEEHEQLKRECVHFGRGWDNAVSKEEGVAAFTAGVRMGITQDERILIDDIVRQRLNTAERYETQLETAELDGFLVPALVPIDPGSAGVDTAFQTQQMLEAEGYTCIAERVSGSKELRAYPLSLAVNSGKAYVALESAVRQEFFKELKNFPLSTFKDQVDAGGDVYRYLFKVLKQGLVVKNYSETRNLVDQVLFNERFGATLPEHWKIYVACRVHDDASKPSGAVILTHAPVNTGLKDSLFVLDSFKATGGHNQVFDWLTKTLTQYEQKPVSMQLRTKSESIKTTMQMKFKMPLMLWDDDAEKGLSELNWFLTPREGEHPFSAGEQECGLYFLREKESDALALRQECITWRYNDKGEPQEYGGILLDCIRMVSSSFRTSATPLTEEEKVIRSMPEIFIEKDNEPLDDILSTQKQLWLQKQMKELAHTQRERKARRGGLGAFTSARGRKF